MKQSNLLLAFFFCLLACTKVGTTTGNNGSEREPDPDPNDIIHFVDNHVAAICIENFDRNQDSQLSYAEAASVSSLGTVFKGSSITSFNELKYFKGVVDISEAFSGCVGLKEVTLPATSNLVLNGTFSGCTSLTVIIIPDAINAIGNAAFYGCTGLTAVTLSKSLTSIGSYAFCGCSGLTSITIPDSVTSIGRGAIILSGSTFSGCTNMRNVIVEAKEPPVIVGAIFSGLPSDFKIVVPKESHDKYLNASGWIQYRDHIVGK